MEWSRYVLIPLVSLLSICSSPSANPWRVLLWNAILKKKPSTSFGGWGCWSCMTWELSSRDWEWWDGAERTQRWERGYGWFVMFTIIVVVYGGVWQGWVRCDNIGGSLLITKFEEAFDIFKGTLKKVCILKGILDILIEQDGRQNFFIFRLHMPVST